LVDKGPIRAPAGRLAAKSGRKFDVLLLAEIGFSGIKSEFILVLRSNNLDYKD
jgi:hypothetical protein